MCMKLSSGKTCRAAQNQLTITIKKKKSKMTGREICSNEHHSKLKSWLVHCRRRGTDVLLENSQLAEMDYEFFFWIPVA